ncbi:uncharacterized protein LOC122543512 isoform X2 [Chiloscyllium plagiosum]|uniref:uncharacterized protein LOC122543512 isoform X2 n=1 Tax=Chiloscyllium plagiosum TaxID=36176 RepID=UPI001CB834D8|nr:uncharacterized protein LOC122543512 isoform X2 [Chiloscyllium plagiosum]
MYSRGENTRLAQPRDHVTFTGNFLTMMWTRFRQVVQLLFFRHHPTPQTLDCPIVPGNGAVGDVWGSKLGGSSTRRPTPMEQRRAVWAETWAKSQSSGRTDQSRSSFTASHGWRLTHEGSVLRPAGMDTWWKESRTKVLNGLFIIILDFTL